MKQKIVATFCIVQIALAGILPSTAQAFTPHFLLADHELVNVNETTLDDIRAVLQRGALADYQTLDHFGRERSAAEIVYHAAHKFHINPKVLLVLLQREQSLVEDNNPTQKQLDWAMGYAICDSCSKDDPRLQKYKGFGNQVYYAAQRIRDSYLTDLALKGHTVSGIGPHIETTIDGRTITPANLATAVLYTYTPHIHGNKNFYKIWQRWFTKQYPSGSLLQDTESEKVWYIKHGKRHPVTSKTALYSRFNPNRIIPVTPDVLKPYDIGSPISYPNYSLLRSPNGAVHLLVDDTLRGITSWDAFRAIGFNPDEIVNISSEEIAHYEQGEPITEESANPQGMLLQDKTTGGIFYKQDNKKHPIMSKEILDERFANWPVQPEETTVLDDLPTGDPVAFSDGTLIAAHGSPDVFVIANGKRHLIPDEAVFLQYGWKWNQIVWTTERAVLAHPLGESIENMPEPDPKQKTHDNVDLATTSL